MPIKIEPKGKVLEIYLTGELDHHNMKPIREEIDFEAERLLPEELILDFAGVTFMDSSGIGLVMGRSRLMQTLGGSVTVRNSPPSVKKVMRLAGLDKIAKFSEKKGNENENTK